MIGAYVFAEHWYAGLVVIVALALYVGATVALVSRVPR
jgi:hypothetical protein